MTAADDQPATSESVSPAPIPRPAFAYLTVRHRRGQGPDAEMELRRALTEFARLQGLALVSVFVDVQGEFPYGFAALRELLRRKPEVTAVVVPHLGHLAHLPLVGGPVGREALARLFGVAVLLVDPTAAPAPDLQGGVK